MTVKELKEALSHYNEKAKIVIDKDDNGCQFTYTPNMYDFGVKGNKDKYDEEDFWLERNPESDVVAITLYR